jgi:uncharacterized protein DUF4395
MTAAPGHARKRTRLPGVPRSLFGFPHPVNEVAARSVAAGVLVLSLLTITLSLTLGRGWLWLTAVLAYGFLARVLTGPTLSPLGQVATRVVALMRVGLIPEQTCAACANISLRRPRAA